VSYGEAARGTRAPFYTTYKSEDRHDRYAWFCGNCDSIDNAMDAMGRIECNNCGNRRKATRWDASSYLPVESALPSPTPSVLAPVLLSDDFPFDDWLHPGSVERHVSLQTDHPACGGARCRQAERK